MHQLRRVFEHIVDGLDDTSFPEHDFVPHGHEPVLHVRPDPRNQVYPILKEHVEEPWRDVAPVGEEFPIKSFCKDSPDLWIPVIEVGPREAERDNLSPVIADEVKFEAVAPSHRPLAVRGQPPKDLVGKASEIVAYGHHGGVHEADARATAKGGEVQEEHHLEKHAALQLHETVVGHGIGEIGFQVLLDEEQVVVLEIAERTELEHDEDGHNLTVGK